MVSKGVQDLSTPSVIARTVVRQSNGRAAEMGLPWAPADYAKGGLFVEPVIKSGGWVLSGSSPARIADALLLQRELALLSAELLLLWGHVTFRDHPPHQLTTAASAASSHGLWPDFCPQRLGPLGS